MKNRKFWSRFLAGALSLTVVSSAMAPSLVDATAGDPPPEIWDDERVSLIRIHSATMTLK